MRSALVAAVVMFAAPALAGSVTGKVEVKEKDGRKAADLSDAVVWVEGAKGAKPKAAAATMTMKGKAFTPHVVVVPVGGTVEFPNDDPIFHNVFSVSGENRFDLQLYKRPKTATQTFKAPGVVRVYCNIHPQMSAVVLVQDSPFYAKAAADGTFTIEGVPPGKYTVKAWHERGGEGAQEVTVGAEPATASFLLDASTFKKAAHKRKDGSDYTGGDRY